VVLRRCSCQKTSREGKCRIGALGQRAAGKAKQRRGLTKTFSLPKAGQAKEKYGLKAKANRRMLTKKEDKKKKKKNSGENGGV